MPRQPFRVFLASIWGMSFPWTLVTSAIFGLGLMLVPLLSGSTGAAAKLNQAGGALALTVATLAMGEPMRLVRYLNVLLGLGIAAGPWIVSGMTLSGGALTTIAGLAVAALSFPCGRITERYGLWQRFVR
jgi:hypothetical protein